MEAVIFLGDGKWELRQVPEPRIEKPDDVILEVERTGICGTDIHILETPPGHPATIGSILGHEYSGRVVDVGSSVSAVKKGDRVVVDPNLTCGLCEFCRQGQSNMCARMTTLGIFTHGGLARYNLAPARALHALSNEVSPERGALAEPLSCIYAAAEKAPPRPGSTVVILGAGPIGLMFLLLYRRMGAGTIVAVEPMELRRRVALDLGADKTVDPHQNSTVADVHKILPSGADLVIDAAGTLFTTAVELARPGGTILLFGMIQKTSQTLSQYDITRKELKILGSFIQRTAFPQVTRLLERQDFPIDKIVSHSLPLNKMADALEAMRQGKALKVQLIP